MSTVVQAGREGREYEKFCKLMTKEVNAAIGGAFEAGATEVLVSDSHGDGQNIDVELLDPRARLVRAWPRPLGMTQGIDSTFDALVFIGFHSAEGAATAIMSHTMWGREIYEIKLNGRAVPEAGIAAAIAGEFGVPVVFLSGDQTVCQDAKNMFGPIETAAVKVAEGFFSATMIHPDDAQRLIRNGVKRGVARRGELSPFKIAPPVKMGITFKRVVNAELASYLPGTERPSGNTIIFTGRDMVEASKFLTAITHINTF
ncbi:MAG: M55 family metallopeptidase [Pyrinomonadaceae bacterium]